MIDPTRDRTRRAGLALAAALLLALPVLAAPVPPTTATDTGVEAAADGWAAFAGLWERLLAFAGVPTTPTEPAAPQPAGDDTTQLKTFDDESEARPSLDPNGVR